MEKLKSGFLLALVTALSACASKGIQKAALPPTAAPTDEVARLESDINAGYSSQFDVLAAPEFAKAQSWLKEAKSDLRDGEKSQEVLDDVAYGRAFLQRTQDLAEGRRAQLQGILESRQAAIDAGARNFPSEAERLRYNDDGVRAVASNRDISSSKFNELQRGYMGIETAAIQATALEQARAKVSAVKRDGGERYTPNVLNQAQLDLTNASNVIAANRHNSSAYQPAVDKADRSAQLAVEVLAAAKNSGDRLSESAAFDMVMAQRKVSHLQGQLTDVQQKSARQTAQLSEAQMVAQLDTALEKARKEFSRDEADVYRQGDKLLIRLKSMNFATGRSDLPAASLPLLAKVKGIADDLNSQQVVIEGHTDSLGSSAKNLELSQNRAEAVAQYLGENGVDSEKIQAVGQGYKAPIATNKTKEGRARNRRVDVTIVPSGATPAN